MKKSLLLNGLIFLLCLPIFATAIEKDLSNVEKIQVTGSRIKRINIEGPSPILILDQQDLENSGYNSVADVLRDTNISASGVGRESFGSASAGGETFANVHGATTLILINGRRVVIDPNETQVDLTLIPIHAVERVEILKDGSSALYGSDALGGVINFILKSDYTGTEFYARIAPTLYPLYKGGSRIEAAAVWGQKYSQGSLTAVFQTRFNHGIISGDRPWANEQISPTSPHPVFTPGTQPNYGTPIVASSCPPERLIDGRCKFNFTHLISSFPTLAQASGYLQGNYKDKGLEYYFHSLLSLKRSNYTYPPLPSSISLKSGHKLSKGTGQPGLLSYRFMELGNRISITNSLGLDNSFGVKGYVNSNWDWDLNLKLSGIFKRPVSKGLLLKNEITQLLTTGEFDPFTANKRNLDVEVLVPADTTASGKTTTPTPRSPKYTAKSINYSLFSLADFVLTGNLGSLDIAMGTQALFNSFTVKSDPESLAGNLVSNASSEGGGHRYILSSYGEISQLLGSSFEWQAAGRLDYYSDFGLTVNPKLAFRYQPHKKFLLRGSVGTSFIAPSLSAVYNEGGEGYPTFTDYVACFNNLKDTPAFAKINDEQLVKDFLVNQKKTYNRKGLDKDSKASLKTLAESLLTTDRCLGAQYHVTVPKNENLKETRGLSASVSSVFQFNDDLSLILDFWYISVDGQSSSGINGDLTKAELLLGSSYVEQTGVTITRGANDPKAIINAVTRYVQTKGSKWGGLDFSFLANFPNLTFKTGNFYFNNSGVIMLLAEGEGFPGAGITDSVGDSGLPRWRNTASVGWKNKKHNLALKVNSTDSMSKATNKLGSVPMYHRLDLSYVWQKDSKTAINAGWNNMLLSVPPIDDNIEAGSKINEAIHDIRGPVFFVGIKRMM